jgi:hypothetical protein
MAEMMTIDAMNRKRGRIRFAVAVGLLALLGTAASVPAEAQTYVTPSTPGWSFVTETPTGSGAFVTGPGTPPSGSPGSIQLTVGNPGAELFYTQQFAGTLLSQLAGLKYNTYVVSSGLPETANMQFDFDPGQSPPPAGYQGRAVFTPALIPSAVSVGVWQSWDPLTQRGWWGTGSPAQRVLAAKCPLSAPCTFSEILGFFPNAKLLAGGVFGFKVGNSFSAAVASVDSFTIGTSGAAGPVTTYNFAPAAPPAASVPVPALGNINLLLLVVLSALVALVTLRRRS